MNHRDVAPDDDRVAVIGMALRFPGADSPEELWSLLLDGRECLTEITDDQLRAAGISEKRIADPEYVRLRPLIDTPGDFDASRFGLTPREAEIMNPQHRLFLEACDEALQRAGVDPAASPQIGVYGGGSPNRYIDDVYLDPELSAVFGDVAIEIANQPDYLATRVSHLLGLTGPGVSVQTACSTALVAVHLAKQALQSGECEMALAGGVSVELPYYTGRQWSPGSIFSKDGHCRAFDAEASGTNFGSGVGVVLLKPLRTALADGDHVHAVLAGSMTNNDGAQRGGYTSPGEDGQAQLLRRCLEASGVDPSSLGYIEAHGTGTLVGDPIEYAALSRALADVGYSGPDVPKIPMGSIKTNLGHLGPAAGIAGLIKTVLSVEHGTVVPSLNFRTPNPAIDMVTNPIDVATAVGPWPRTEERVALVSSFGIGGTNAVALVTQAPPTASATGPASQPSGSRARLVVPISGVSAEHVLDYAAHLAEHLDLVEDEQFAGTVRTVRSRAAHRYRAAVVAGDPREAARLLRGDVRARRAGGSRTGWMFPGQGAQFPGMVGRLGAATAPFHTALEECLEEFATLGLTGLRALLVEGRAEGDLDGDPDELLRQTYLAQPALFAIEYSLARAWSGVADEPRALVGHSIGEYAAATYAGVMSVRDACRAVAERGRLMQSMPPGAMVAVMRDLAQVGALLPDDLDVAAVNGPSSFVVSGPSEAVAAFTRKLNLLAIDHSMLHTSHAFHSRMMEPAATQLHAFMSTLDLHAPRIPIVSTVTGVELREEEATDPDYWRRQLVQPVLFGDAITHAATAVDIVAELGPGSTLCALTRAAVDDVACVTVLPRTPDGSDDRCLEALADLWAAGGAVDWTALEADQPHKVPTPAAPFRRQTHWVEDDDEDEDEETEQETGPLPLERAGHLPLWRPAPRPSGDLRGPWLVIDANGALAPVVDRLREIDPATHVLAGDPTADTADGWRAQFEQLPESSRHPGCLVYVHDTGAQPGSSGFYRLLHVLQAAAETWRGEPLTVRVVTTSAASVSSQDEVDPFGALAQAVTVVANETPGMTGGTVDLEQWPTLPGQVRQLVRELTQHEPETRVALRGRGRWSLAYTPFPVMDLAAEAPAVIRPGGTYVVTGGTGAIGVEILRALAATPGTKVALLSRGGPTALGYQDNRLREPLGDTAHNPRLQAALKVANRNGVEVLALRADVASPDSVAAALAEVREQLGPVTGLFHAAGVAGGQLAVLRDDEAASRVLAPKLDGTRTLHAALHGEAEFMMLFSSIIAVTSDVGMVDYCAANSFLDAFAVSVSDERTRVISVNWCGWSEVGMVVTERSLASDQLRDAEMGIVSRPMRHPLLDRRLIDADQPTYTALTTPETGDFRDDHRMAGQRAVSGTTLVEMVRAAAEDATGAPVAVTDVVLGAPLHVAATTEVVVTGNPDGDCTDWHVTARTYGSREAVTQTVLVARTSRAQSPATESLDLDAVRRRCAATDWLPSFDDPSSPVQVGQRWRALEEIALGPDGEQLLMLSLPPSTSTGGYLLHPVLLDNATALGLCLPDVLSPGTGFLPAGYERVDVWAATPSRAVCWIRRRTPGPVDGQMAFDIVIADEHGSAVAQVTGFTISLVDADGPVAPAAAPVAVAREVDDELQPDDYLFSPDEALALMDALLRQDQADHVILSRQRLDQRFARIGRHLQEQDVRSEPEDDDLGDLTPVEASLMRMWRSALGQSQLVVDDDFFAIGGNSLLAVQMVARIRKELTVALPGRALIENPTIKSLAQAIEDVGVVAP